MKKYHTDLGSTTKEKLKITRPIHIQHWDFGTQFVNTGDTLQVTIDDSFHKPVVKAFRIEQTMQVNHAVKFEVIDEFGMDVGIGVVIGHKKGT